MLIRVLKQQTLGEHFIGHERNRRTGTLIVLHSSYRLVDKLFCKIAATGNSDTALNRVEIIILPNRTNILLIDLIIARRKTTITNKNRSGDFLIEHHSHLRLEPSDNIEISNIYNIVSIELLLLINGRRSSCSLKQREYFFLLKIALNITLGPSVILGNVCKHGLNPGERSMVYTVHNYRHPTHFTLNKLRRIIKSLGFREQSANFLNTIVFCMSKKTLLERAVTLSIINNSVHSVMRKNLLIVFIIFKYVMLHIFVSSFSIFFTILFKNLAYKSINYSLLLFG